MQLKSYTDIEQSKKLADILPLESADMNWHELPSIGCFARIFPYKKDNGATEGIFPCWSLAALLGVLPPIEGFRPIIDLDINLIRYEGNYRDKLCFNENNLIDACYEMIIHLNELNLL